ncbi:hypothetical protein BG011_000200 [Mortierella polycephala]|uniref:Uncharacterized protein n=1 Tax=Mortierella polycephala TaxID=41804 RepID=A0A9P6Q7J3_9FUNG|nr:hypothetical protein BG011_000200 [Mortierella polycephala]
MSLPLVAVDPVDLSSFALSSKYSTVDQKAFQKVHGRVHQDLSNPSSSSRSLRLYIVQQPVPAKHRRSYIETRNLRSLCGHPISESSDAKDLDHSAVVMKRMPDCVDLSALRVSQTPSAHTSASSGIGSEVDSVDDQDSYYRQRQANLKNMGENQVASWLSNSVEYMHNCISSEYVHSQGQDTDAADIEEYTDTDIEADDGSDGDGVRDAQDVSNSRSRRIRRLRDPVALAEDPNRCLPEWFRPKVVDGEVQFEIWVVAFLKDDDLLGCGGGKGTEKQLSEWIQAVNELLEDKIMQDFVGEEVAAGNIGIDFKRILESKKKSRQPTRRYIR